MFSSLIATLAGSATKVAVVTSVTAASVGGAYVSDAVDVPLLPDEPAVEEVVESPEELAFEEEETIEDEAAEDEAADETVEETIADDEGTDDEGAEDEPSNHGAEVSEFVHETELEGCEKGHAVAALASGKEEKADKECPDHDDDAVGSDDDDDADDADDDDDHETDADDEQKTEKDDNGNNGNNGGNGKRGDK